MVHVKIDLSNFPLTLTLCGKMEIFSNLASWAAGSPFQSKGFRRNTLETDFPFVIILVILAVNHFSVLYLLCFSTVVIKSKPERHPELHRALFRKAKEYHVSAFEKLLSFSKTTKSHIIACSQKRNNHTNHPFCSRVPFPPVTFPESGLELNLA